MTVDVPAPAPAPQEVPDAGWVRRFQRALPVLGIAGLAVWIAATPFRIDTPPLVIDRKRRHGGCRRGTRGSAA